MPWEHSASVFKAHAGSELLAALEAVLEGRRVASRGLSGHSLTDATGPQASRFRTQAGSPIAGTEKKEIARIHEVEFYSDDAVFLAGLIQLCRNRSRSREQSDRGCDRVTPERSSPGIAGTWRGYCYCRSARALSPFGCRRDPLKIHGRRDLAASDSSPAVAPLIRCAAIKRAESSNFSGRWLRFLC